MFPHSIVTLDSWTKVTITQFLPPCLQGFTYLKSTEKYSEFFVLIPLFNLLMTLLESLFILNWPSHFIKWDNRKSRIIHLLDLSGLPIKFASSIDQQEWQLENAPELSETFLKILPTEGPWKKANQSKNVSLFIKNKAEIYESTIVKSIVAPPRAMKRTPWKVQACVEACACDRTPSITRTVFGWLSKSWRCQ